MKNILIFSVFAFIVSGCSAVTVNYNSGVSNPTRMRANMIVRFENQNISSDFLDKQTQQSVIHAIETDLQESLFAAGNDTADVMIRIEKMTYSNSPYGLIWFPLIVIGLPLGKVEGSVQIYVEMRSHIGNLLRSYRSAKTDSYWYNMVYYNKEMTVGNSGGIVSELLKNVLEEIKYKIIDDRYQIVEGLKRAKNQGAGIALTQGSAVGSSDVDSNIPRTSVVNPEAAAVVIGISDYQDPSVPRVEHARQDAAAMRQYLINTLGYDEKNILPRNPDQVITAGVFKTLIRQELPGFIKPGLSDVFVYYSGHGAPSTAAQKAFFVPADCNPNFVNNDNAYLLDQFYDDLAKLTCKNLTVVIDACFSGLSGNGEMLIKNASPLYLTVEHPLLAKENAVLITSAKSDQVSNWFPEKQHGMFTYFFLKGLQGAADLNKDGEVTLQELETYILDPNESVPYWSKREYQRPQTPQMNARDKQKVIVKY